VKQYPRVIFKFTASWCKPCKAIHPFYESLSLDFKEIQFCVIDVDEVEDVSNECGVAVMPTFVAFFNGEKVKSVTGANEDRLLALVKEVIALR